MANEFYKKPEETIEEYYARTPTADRPGDIITTADLEPREDEFIIPDLTNARTNFSPIADQSLQNLLEVFNQTSPAEQTSEDLQKEIIRSLDVLGGERQKQQELEQETGLTQQRQELQGVINQLQTLEKERLAIPLEIQEESRGRGVTKAGMAPIESSRLRKNTIEALGLSAIAQTYQGNIALAESSIQNALEAEFEPERIRIATLQQLYTFNKDLLEREDAQRTQRLGIVLNERSRVLAIQEVDKKEVYEIGLAAQRNGADTITTQKIFQATSPEEALMFAGTYIQDPKAKIEIENARLDNILRRTQIEKENYQLQLLQKYGGLSPSEYKKLLEEEQDRIELEKDERRKAELQGEAINEKINLIDSVLDSNAIDSVVGPSFISRSATDISGLAGRFVAGATTGAVVGSVIPGVGTLLGGIAGGLTLAGQGVKDYFTGSSDKLVGQVEQFISKEFLQNLIDVKQQGATFGALQKAEQDALTAAATFIGQRRITEGTGEDKRVVGYDMSEKDFRREMNTIREMSKRAYERSTGSIFDKDEQQIFDELESLSETFNPSF